MKKIQLSILLISLMMPIVANADKSGACGDGLTYYFNETTNTLTISGTGPMYNYSHDPTTNQCPPWYSYRSMIEKVSIESGVTSIGTSAFYHSVNIKTVIIPNSIEKIYNYAFSNCSALESIDLPPYLSFIAQEAFSKCTSLSSVSIQSVEMIYLDAFKDCNNIQYVNIKSIEDWCKISFQSINSNPLSFANHLYLNGVEIKDLVIPNNISFIGNCQFYSCNGLTSVVIPEGVKEINQSAFAGCYNLSTITIPNTVTTIWNNAFERCAGLTKIYLGQSIELIREYCFQTCTSLKDFYCYSVTPPTTRKDLFYNTPYSDATLHVPTGAIENYKQKEPWKYFKRIVETDVQMYSLKYLIDDNEYVSYSIIEGETIPPILSPEIEGYTFSSWSEIPETMPAHDVTITGSFTVNQYNLTYKVDGETYKTYEIDYGATITPEEEPQREGHSFSGWSDIPETMPAEDVTVTGTFTVNKYKVTYMIDGEVFKTESVEYGASITPPDAPGREGYTFSWSGVPETMPAQDITITGTYTTGIDGIMADEQKKMIFNMNGQRIDKLQKGLYIIQLKNGKMKKVVVK